MEDDYQVIESQRQFTGEVFSVDLDMLRLPDGQTREREVVHHPGAVGIVALTEEEEVLLVSQYRHPAHRFLVEIPAGKLDKGEGPASCAARELKEETGAVPKMWTKIGEFYTTPGYSDERFHLYLATDCEVGASSLDDDEEQGLRVVRMALSEAIQSAREGRFEDGKTIVGILLAALYLEA